MLAAETTQAFKIVAPVVAGGVWVWLISPLLGRLFAIPVPFGPPSTGRTRKLTASQFIFSVGVLGIGVGMFITSVGWQLLRPGVFFETAQTMTLQRLIVLLITWLTAGLFIGVLSRLFRRE
ncbi:MAG: hypothetical protein WA294_01495 [Acidobacteriaceae bacterium]